MKVGVLTANIFESGPMPTPSKFLAVVDLLKIFMGLVLVHFQNIGC